jgi:hypothetical protein
MHTLPFTVDYEFKTLIPSLTQEEFAGLEAKLLAEGCTEPFIVWKEQNILLDGHTRLNICAKHQLQYTTREISQPDREAAKQWIIQHALARRSLSEPQKSMLRGLMFKKALKDSAYGDKVESLTTLAAQYNISYAQVRRDIEFSEAASAVIEKAGDPARQVIQQGKVTKALIHELADENSDTVKREVVLAANEIGQKYARKLRKTKKKKKTTPKGAAPRGDAYEGLTQEEQAVESTDLTAYDMQGTELPANLRDEFADSLFDDLTNYVKQCMETVRANQKGYPYLFGQPFFDQCDGLIYLLECHRPWVVCDQCQGAGCKHCRLSGYLSKHQWEQVKRMTLGH